MASQESVPLSVIAVAAAAAAVLVLSTPCGALSNVVVPRVQAFGDFPNVDKFRERKQISALTSIAIEELNVTFSRDVVDRLVIGQRVVVNVTIACIANVTAAADGGGGGGCNGLASLADRSTNRTTPNFTLSTSLTDLRVLRLVSAERSAVSRPSGEEVFVSIVLEGADIGYSFVKLGVNRSERPLRAERNDVLVSVVRPPGVLDLVYQVFVYAVLVIGQVSMGSQIDLVAVKKAIRRPKALLSGIGCQFIVMPLLSYGLLNAMQWRGGAALGFFSLGCAPGGGLSNLFTALLGGDLTLSISLTLLNTVLALGFIPLWMFTLGATLPSDEGLGPIRIPFENMLISLAITVGPLFVGLLIRLKLPRVTAFITKVIKPVFLVIVLILFVLLFVVNSFMFERFDASLVLTAAALPIGGFLISMFVAYALRLKWQVIKTVSIETGFQNAMIATIIVNWSLEKPAADLALVPVAAAFLIGPLPLVVVSVLYTVYWKCVDARAAKKLGAAVSASGCNASADMTELTLQKKSGDARPGDGGGASARLGEVATKASTERAEGSKQNDLSTSEPRAGEPPQ